MARLLTRFDMPWPVKGLVESTGYEHSLTVRPSIVRMFVLMIQALAALVVGKELD